MALTKEDLGEIKKIIDATQMNLNDQIEKTEKRIISIIGEEISDLADINRAVINKIAEHDHCLEVIERKISLGV